MTTNDPTTRGTSRSDELISDPLTRSSEDAHAHARALLTGPDAPVMDAVVWLSAHLAAMELIVYPVMATTLTEHQDELERQRAATRRMHRGLRLIEQRYAGDGLIRVDSVRARPDRLLVMMEQHAARERALLAHLAEALDEQAASSLAARYDGAVRHGPTGRTRTAHTGAGSDGSPMPSTRSATTCSTSWTPATYRCPRTRRRIARWGAGAATCSAASIRSQRRRSQTTRQLANRNLEEE